MVLPVFNFIGNWLYEANKVLCEPEVDDLKDPEDFKPGALFGLSASWVLLVRTLLVPDYARKGLPAPRGCLATCGGSCPESDGASSSANSSTSSSTTSSSGRCNKKSSSGDLAPKRKKSGFSFRC